MTIIICTYTFYCSGCWIGTMPYCICKFLKLALYQVFQYILKHHHFQEDHLVYSFISGWRVCRSSTFWNIKLHQTRWNHHAASNPSSKGKHEAESRNQDPKYHHDLHLQPQNWETCQFDQIDQWVFVGRFQNVWSWHPPSKGTHVQLQRDVPEGHLNSRIPSSKWKWRNFE